MSKKTKPRFTYAQAAQAMQAGVALDHQLDALQRTPGDGSPKHLRVGVNSALVDSAGLARLLIEKGILTEEEYGDAIAEEMNAEVAHYEDRLSMRTGEAVTLSPGCATIGGKTNRTA